MERPTIKLIDRRQHSNVLDIRMFRGADCDTDHYLMVAKVRERLAVSKQTTQRFYMVRLCLNKLNKVEAKDQYWIEISIKFTTLGNLR
jgi:hypothetical protein